MRRLFALPLLGALAILALPGSALATHGGSDCEYAGNQDVTTFGVTGPTAAVYADNSGGDGGTTGEAETAAGACANTGTGPFQGGTAEVGSGQDGSGDAESDGYAVVDGDNENTDPSGQSDGYFGLSNWETSPAGRDTECTTTGPDQGQAASSNSGGCVGLDAGVWVDLTGSGVPTPMCGNTSGNTWDGSGGTGTHARDGCSIP